MQPEDFLRDRKGWGDEEAVWEAGPVPDLAAAWGQHRVASAVQAALTEAGWSHERLSSAQGAPGQGEGVRRRLRGMTWMSLSDLMAWTMLFGTRIVEGVFEAPYTPPGLLVAPSWREGTMSLPELQQRGVDTIDWDDACGWLASTLSGAESGPSRLYDASALRLVLGLRLVERGFPAEGVWPSEREDGEVAATLMLGSPPVRPVTVIRLARRDEAAGLARDARAAARVLLGGVADPESTGGRTIVVAASGRAATSTVEGMFDHDPWNHAGASSTPVGLFRDLIEQEADATIMRSATVEVDIVSAALEERHGVVVLEVTKRQFVD
ncbi:hypothetical protein [Euzebya tangerina]|uniref:hypothetical protein n=1 Tax=Euzebya tangerina TaxID=591198 RepID=UPI0013C345E3|nr:hypothetical protein [Euzebya tangerina]